MSSPVVKTGFMLEDVEKGFILQQVNCQGKMGSGIALAIKTKWPIVEQEYHEFCRTRPPALLLSQILPIQVEPGKWIINLFSQLTYGRNPAAQPGGRYTSYDALADAAKRTADFANTLAPDYPTINYPMIGCGLGGGDWTIVSAILNSRFDKMDHCYWEYKP